MKHFISVADVTDINALVQQALSFKKALLQQKNLGAGKRLGLLFLNPSMRTRLSTQIAAQNLGIEPIVFNIGPEGWALEFAEGAVMNGTTVEHVKDAAPVLGQYFDILGIRTFPGLKNRDEDYSEQYIQQFIKWCGVPVLSLESATLHPLQSLADVITITELRKKAKPKIVLTWAPHVKAVPQCVANSFAQWITTWGEAEFVITHPEGYELDEQFTKGAIITHNQKEALQGADFLYVKAWSSYKDYGKVLSTDPSWMPTLKHLSYTNSARVMHCLPVRRNIELSDEVLDGKASCVTQQAGNRVWAAQAVLQQLLSDK